MGLNSSQGMFPYDDVWSGGACLRLLPSHHCLELDSSDLAVEGDRHLAVLTLRSLHHCLPVSVSELRVVVGLDSSCSALLALNAVDGLGFL